MRDLEFDVPGPSKVNRDSQWQRSGVLRSSGDTVEW